MNPTTDPAEDPEAPSDGCRTFAGAIEPIFAQRCTACHGEASPAEGLSLVRGAAHANLVGVASRQQPGALRVAPSSPDTSWLIEKVGAAPRVGARMPLGGTPLADAEIDLIREWISAGAPDGSIGDCDPNAPIDTPPSVFAIEVDAAATVGVAATHPLTATAYDENGAPISGVSFAWRVVEEEIAYVDGTGLLLGVSEGNAHVVAEAEGIESEPSAVTVGAAELFPCTFESNIMPIFTQQCALSGCHTHDDRAGDLELDRGAENAYYDLVDEPADAVDASRIAPQSPLQSHLFLKITRSLPPAGERMPLGRGPIPAGDAQQILNWILRGAYY